jgi:hypothetical protein
MPSARHEEPTRVFQPPLSVQSTTMSARTIMVTGVAAAVALLIATTAFAAGFTRHRVPGQRLSLETPATWRVRTTSPFLIVDPVARNGFSTNANVVVEAVPTGTSLARYRDALVAQIRTIHRGTISQRFVDLPGGRALRLSYTPTITVGGLRKKVATLQYCFVRSRKGFVVTYTALPTDAARYAPTFEQSARSIRFG